MSTSRRGLDRLGDGANRLPNEVPDDAPIAGGA